MRARKPAPMEDVVGIRVVDEVRGEVGYVCWGRLHDPVDPTRLLERIRTLLPDMGFKNVVDVAICEELGELHDFKYFYETLIEFSSEYKKKMKDRSWMRKLESSDAALRKTLYLLPGRRSPHPAPSGAGEPR